MKARNTIIGCMVVLVLLLSISVVCANDDYLISDEEFKDSFQYHSGDDYTDTWIKSGSGTVSITNYPAGYPWSNALYLYTTSNVLARSSTPHGSNYWAFNVRLCSSYLDDHMFAVNFYDEDGDMIESGFPNSPMSGLEDSFPLLWSTTYGSDYNYLQGSYSSAYGFVELYISGTDVNVVVDGIDKGVISGATCSRQPYFIEFEIQDGHTGGWQKVYIDGVTQGDGFIAIDHETNPTHTTDEIADNELDIEWSIKHLIDSEYILNPYYIKVKRQMWDEWYNITTLKEAGDNTTLPSGIVVYDKNVLFQEDDYGLYFFQLWKGSESTKISEDWIFFDNLGDDSWVDIEETEYAIGDSITINYSIGDPDFGANDYFIYMYDSGGNLVETQSLTEAESSIDITSTIEWDEGTCWAVLVEDTQPSIDMDPPTDINELAYDVTYMLNYIFIAGTCYDASNPLGLVTGTPLANVSVNFSHNDDWYNDTSDANGYYEFLDAFGEETEFYKDVPINVHASLDEYNFEDYTMTLIRAGTYEIDLYFVPSERERDLENASIAGIVTDDVFHQAVGGATVSIQNDTWSSSDTTNTWGYYEFLNLENDSYYLRVSKETYATTAWTSVNAWNVSYLLDDCDTLDYYSAVLDECDATTGWNSSNYIQLNEDDYVETTGSLNATGNGTVDFWKCFDTPVDANVTENGYFYFYSKVDGVENISSNVTVIIGSNCSNSSDCIWWDVDKDLFTDEWNLTLLPISEGTEIGDCNLSAITYFELNCTKTGNVTFWIDYLAFIEWVGWSSDLFLSLDASDKMEGSASIQADGEAWAVGEPIFWLGPGHPPEIPMQEWYVARYFASNYNAGAMLVDNPLARLEYYYKDVGGIGQKVLLSSDADATEDYLFWTSISDPGYATWYLERLWLEDAYENVSIDMSSIDWLVFFGNRTGIWNLTDNYDYIRLRQVGTTYQNFELTQYYTLTVRAKDYDTHNTITEFTAVFDETRTLETTTGYVEFTNVTYGIYRVEASAEGYYTGIEYVFVGADTEETIYLVEIEEGGGGVSYNYPAATITFRVISFMGVPYEGVNVTVTPIAITSDWDWLWQMAGFTTETTSLIQNTTLSGTTDHNGEIVFTIAETVKYHVTITKASAGINKTLDFYPRNNEIYTIYIWSVDSEIVVWNSFITNCTINVTTETIDATHAFINVSYTDNSGGTALINYTINISEISGISNESLVVEDYATGGASINISEIVEDYSGKMYYIRLNITHSAFGNVQKTYSVKFRGVRLDLGWSETTYLIFSVCVIFIFGLVFGSTTADYGALITCIPGWMFYSFGWFDPLGYSAPLVLSIATVISILYIIIKRGQEAGYQ